MKSIALACTALSCLLAWTSLADAAQLSVHVNDLTSMQRLPDSAASCRFEQPSMVKPGRNQSLGVRWSPGPKGTQSYALLMSDRDVPSDHSLADKPGVLIPVQALRHEITHWLLVDIPATTANLQAGETRYGVSGKNTHGILGYSGPCPPWNDAQAHRYVIQIFALDVRSLHLSRAFRRADVEQAMKGHVLATGSITQTYAVNPAQNAQLLRHQGMAFWLRGNIDEAYTNFMSSLRWEKQPPVVELLKAPEFSEAKILKTARWQKGQTGAILLGMACLCLVFIVLMILGSQKDNAQADSSQSEATPAANTTFSPQFVKDLKDCRSNSKEHANITVSYAACKDAISAVDEMKSGTTGIDLDEGDLLKASLQTYEAGNAALLGYKSEASSLFAASTATFKRLSTRGILESTRTKARKWYDCNVNNVCNS